MHKTYTRKGNTMITLQQRIDRLRERVKELRGHEATLNTIRMCNEPGYTPDINSATLDILETLVRIQRENAETFLESTEQHLQRVATRKANRIAR
jgi:hypothetical protein